MLPGLLFSQEICNNGIDDDGDGLVDLNDSTECFCPSPPPVPPLSFIPNPSFEDTLCCPNWFSQLNCADSWIQASDATSDYYNTCGYTNIVSFVAPPQFPIPNNGAGYVGFYTDDTYMEYIGACLLDTMFANTSYTITFYTAFGLNSTTQSISIFGTSECTDLPWTGWLCPEGVGNWVQLDSQIVEYDGNGAWQQVVMTFTPTTDITAIAIGGSCNGINLEELSYYYVDELIIDSTVNFVGQIMTEEDVCAGELSLFTPLPDSLSTIQWYLDGIALVGETAQELDADQYGSGIYTAFITESDGDCVVANMTVDTILTAAISFDSLYVVVNCGTLNNNSISLFNIVGPDSIYSVTLSDSVGNIFIQDTIFSNDDIVFNNLVSGTWAVNITSFSGCPIDTSIQLSQNEAITVTSTINPPQCFGTSNGSITAFTNYSGDYVLTISDNLGVQLNNPGTNTANVLPAGTYVIEIIDTALNCSVTEIIELLDPPELDINLDLTHNLCHGFTEGQAIVDTVLNNQGAYPGISYYWSPNPNGVNGLGETENSGLVAGEYVLEIEDDIGCTKQITFYITEPDPLAGQLNVISPTFCRIAGHQKGNGEVAVTVSPDSLGSGNVVYEWKNLTNGETSPNTTFVVNEPGWMRATLVDANGCIFIDSVYVDSLNPEALFTPLSDDFTGPGEYEGTEDVTVEFINESINFSKAGYLFSDTLFVWNLYTNDPNLTGQGNWFLSFDYDEKIEETYKGEEKYLVCLVAKNFNDCRDTFCREIEVHKFPVLNVPNVFTPGTTPNNTFYFPSEGIETFNCIMFNRYGIEVFRYNSITEAWDGNHQKNGNPCSEGVYFFSYKAVSTNGTLFEGQGHVQLIRPK